MQWLKIYGNLEQFTSYVDKYEVRAYAEAKVGKQHLIPLIGVWDSFDDIPFKSLPNQFVMKATHGSGYNEVVTNKQTLDVATLREKMTQWLKTSYYDHSGETQYKLCTPKIIVEKYIKSEDNDLKDYKFYCFKGKPELLMVGQNRQKGLTIDVLDMDWKPLPVPIGVYPTAKVTPHKPAQFNLMAKLAAQLSADFPFVRVDLYTAHGKVYFGELTFTPSSGLEVFGSKEFSRWFGSKIDLTAYNLRRS